MNEEGNSYLGFGFFFLFILGIVCVGTFLVYQNYTKKMENKEIVTEEKEKISDKLKIEKAKDFVYYQEEVSISENLSLVYKYPIINLESEDALDATKELKNIINEKKASVEKINTNEIDTTCSESVDGIRKATVLDFGVFTYNEYVTLILYESMYSCDSGISSILKMRSYTFNVLTGKRLSATDLLSLYNTSFSKGITQIREELIKNQYENNIKIEETIRNLKENETYILYISEEGELILKYIVKTNTVDYNDNISLK